MRALPTLILGVISLTVASEAQALDCPVPGTTLAWTTDQCLLETGATDATSAKIQDCVRAKNTIRQPCEWNEFYKKQYCATLIEKRKIAESLEDCVADPSRVGPTVQQLILKHAGEA